MPIKFALPPFTNSAVTAFLTNRVVLDDGFENAVEAGNVPAGSYVSGWHVDRDNVDVLGPNLFNFHGPANTGTNFLDIHGDMDGMISTNFPTTAGRQYRVSFAYAASQFASIPTSFRVGIDGTTLVDVIAPPTGFLPGGALWKTNSAVFTAGGPITHLSVESLVADSFFGVLLDTFKVEEIIDGREAYFLPEETLQPFVGESAFGNWTLEVLDNRVGLSPSPRTPFVLSWKLDFTFANTNPPALTLTNCEPFTNVVSLYETNCVPLTNVVAGDEIKYFIVNVPRRATMATNILDGSGALLLLFNQDGLPSGTQLGDYL